MKCEVCNTEHPREHCTANVCEDCCKSGKCLYEDKCVR